VDDCTTQRISLPLVGSTQEIQTATGGVSESLEVNMWVSPFQQDHFRITQSFRVSTLLQLQPL
jgi:hypothetical protein